MTFEKIFDKKLASALLLLCGFLLMGNSCAEPIYTQVSYNVNNYQDGKTIGRGKFSSTLGAQTAPTFQTKMELSESYDSNKVNLTPYNFVPDYSKSAFVANYTGRYGVTRNFDFIMDLMLGINDGGAAPGLKLYGKYRLTSRRSAFNVSLMPGIGYTTGTISQKDAVDLESNLLALEFLLPMSYDFSDDIALHFGLKSYYFYYNVPAEYRWRENTKDMEAKKTFEKYFFAPAFSVGFRYKWICPEITISKMDDKFLPYFGIGIVVK